MIFTEQTTEFPYEMGVISINILLYCRRPCTVKSWKDSIRPFIRTCYSKFNLLFIPTKVVATPRTFKPVSPLDVRIVIIIKPGTDLVGFMDISC